MANDHSNEQCTEKKSIFSRKKHKLPLLLPTLSSKQVIEITHFLRMGRLDFIALKGPDNTCATLRISLDGTVLGREGHIQQRLGRKPSDTGGFVCSNILENVAIFCFNRS